MKTGLVLEGGGMRGLFTAGVMDVMMEHGIRFDGIVGVSAGATFGCNYKSRQVGRVLRYNVRFKDDPRYKVNLNTVDVYLHCCTEDLNAYLTSVAQAGGVNAEHSVYTNIKGGVGVFAARRTHIYKSMPFEQNNSDEGISTKISQLGINMH